MAVISESSQGVSVYSLMKSGDIVIDEIIITSCNGFKFSLRVAMQQIIIYEDIYNNSLSGSIIILDGLNLAKHLPIIGNEDLTVTFYTPGQPNQALNKIELNLKIYQISQREKAGTENQILMTLQFVSKEFFNNNTVKFSQSYTNMTYGHMVNEIFKTYFLDQTSPTLETDKINLFLHQTFGKKSLVVPFWSPLYTINWISNRSYMIGSSGERLADFMFYQTIDGKYNFYPMSYLKTKDSVATYRHVPSDSSEGVKLMDNATNFIIVDSGDKMKDVGSGTFASSLTTIDVTKKQIENSVFNYKKSFNNLAHVAKHPLIPAIQDKFSDKSMSYRKIQPKHSYRYDKVKDIDNYDEYILYRQSLMNQLNSITIRIDAPGDSRRRVGDIVEFEMTSTEDVSKKIEKTDPYISGRYMVTKIAHYLRTEEYIMVMTLSKDSYDNPIADVKEASLETLSNG